MIAHVLNHVVIGSPLYNLPLPDNFAPIFLVIRSLYTAWYLWDNIIGKNLSNYSGSYSGKDSLILGHKYLRVRLHIIFFNS